MPASYQPHQRAQQGLRPIRSAQSVTCDAWYQFLERFAAALKAAGFSNGWNQAMAQVFHEMADNTVQHSELGTTEPINGIAGYSVQERRMNFTIVDVGIGALNSLRDNPRYAEVSNGREALDLIAHDKASRRTDQDGPRSGDGVFMMEGTLGCSAIARSLHTAPGFTISVECKI